jgi:flagellar hook assembly protein FlgD
VELAIFDISGRRITRLVSQTMSAGEHSIMWHGTDSRGSRVASGVYFYQITAGTLVETKRMILVK